MNTLTGIFVVNAGAAWLADGDSSYTIAHWIVAGFMVFAGILGTGLGVFRIIEARRT